jgi:anti-anti-sigma factor
MSDSSAVEIKFCDHQVVVFPSAKLINRRRSANRITSEVSAALQRRPGECPMTDVVMDMSQVGWLSSAGLNELIRLQAQSRASGIKFRLRSTSETVREVFRITRLERTFQFDSEASEKLLEKSLSD